MKKCWVCGGPTAGNESICALCAAVKTIIEKEVKKLTKGFVGQEDTLEVRKRIVRQVRKVLS